MSTWSISRLQPKPFRGNKRRRRVKRAKAARRQSSGWGLFSARPALAFLQPQEDGLVNQNKP